MGMKHARHTKRPRRHIHINRPTVREPLPPEVTQSTITKLTSALVQGIPELVQGWWNLQALEQDSPAALEAHVLRPPHEVGQVTLGLDGVTNAVVALP